MAQCASYPSGGSLVILTLDRDGFRIRRDKITILSAFVVAGANAWFIHNLVRRIWALKQSGELYFGGQRGFLADTVESLIEGYFYLQPYSSGLKNGILFGTAGAFVIACVVLGWRAWKDRGLTFATLLMFVLLPAIAAPIIERRVVGTPYPIQRTALYFVPLLTLMLVFTINENIPCAGRKFRSALHAGSLLLIAAMTVHFARTANLRYTFSWNYDADTKRAMLDVGRQFGSEGIHRKINIGNSWWFEPSINYYRATLHYDWLNRADRNRLYSNENDVIYCFPSDLNDSLSSFIPLERYPVTGNVLLTARRGLAASDSPPLN